LGAIGASDTFYGRGGHGGRRCRAAAGVGFLLFLLFVGNAALTRPPTSWLWTSPLGPSALFSLLLLVFLVVIVVLVLGRSIAESETGQQSETGSAE
jgi:hypothetical protein